MATTSTPRHCGRQSVERYPPIRGKKGGGDEESREDEYKARKSDTTDRDSEDGGVEYEDVAHLQSSDGE